MGATSDATPPVIPRLLDIAGLLEKKSHSLLGPRLTGKSFLIRHTLKGIRVYDLLDTVTFLALSQEPGRLHQELGPKNRLVVIDEIQRLPGLLNEVHRLIEERGIQFLLTGSSARKLRRGGVNLLGEEEGLTSPPEGRAALEACASQNPAVSEVVSFHASSSAGEAIQSDFRGRPEDPRNGAEPQSREVDFGRLLGSVPGNPLPFG